MVYGRYNELVFMGFINQLITGGHHPVVICYFTRGYKMLQVKNKLRDKILRKSTQSNSVIWF